MGYTPRNSSAHASRNAIIASQMTSGNADFFTTDGTLTLTLVANSTDPFEYDIDGQRIVLTANVTLAVTDNANNFILIDTAGALSRSANPVTYAFSAPGAPASGDYWFDLGKNAMKTYNGSAWVASKVISVGYVRADSTVINTRYVCEPTALGPYQRYERFGDGATGFLNVSSGTTTIDGTKKYSGIAITGTGVVTHTANPTTTVPGTLTVYCQGPCFIGGTGGINLDGKGKGAGSGATGAGGAGSGSSHGGNGGGGGGGTSAGGAGGNIQIFASSAQVGTGSAGSGGGGTGGNGMASQFPSSSHARNAGAWYQLYGTGGGGGGGDGGSAGANGGAGGGGINLFAPAIGVASGALLTANGANGTVGGGANRGGGGAGGGGILNVCYRNYWGSGTITANGGTGGGSGGAGSGAGGNGGAGVVSLERI